MNPATTASAVTHLVVSHLASILGFAMAVVLVARSARQRRPTGSTLAWVLAIVLIPYVGVPLYLAFGGRKLRQRSATKQKLYPALGAPIVASGTTTHMLCASGAPAPTAGNRVELLGTGEVAYAAVLEAIERAQRSIHVSTLIFAGDEVGLAISDRLEAKGG
jgi:cardiolipin synthase